MVLISSCANQPPQESTPVTYTSPNDSELLFEPHWQLSYFDEPVFNSKMAVLETGNIENPTIILIHGLGQLGMKDWFGVIPTLEENYHVIAIDLPGFGLSVGAQGRFSPTNYSRVISAINYKYGHGDAIVIGHSMGGAVALRYTEQYEERVEKLVLIDAAGILEKTAFIKHIAALEQGEDESQLVKTLIGGVNDVSSSMIEGTTKNIPLTSFLQNNDKAWDWLVSDSANMNAALSLVEEDFSQAIQKIKVPVNIIWGEKDNVAPIRTGKVLNKQMNNTRLQVIEGASHVPMKSHKDEFNNALISALDEPLSDKLLVDAPQVSKGSLSCRGESDKTYSGFYDEIALVGCNNISLKNITTNRLTVKGSVVDVENLIYSNQHEKIIFNGSVVTITNANITGHDAMLISGSRIDMAGVSIKATGEAVMIGNGSRISISLSDVISPKYTGKVHGVFYLSKQSLFD